MLRVNRTKILKYFEVFVGGSVIHFLARNSSKHFIILVGLTRSFTMRLFDSLFEIICAL